MANFCCTYARAGLQQQWSPRCDLCIVSLSSCIFVFWLQICWCRSAIALKIIVKIWQIVDRLCGWGWVIWKFLQSATKPWFGKIKIYSVTRGCATSAHAWSWGIKSPPKGSLSGHLCFMSFISGSGYFTGWSYTRSKTPLKKSCKTETYWYGSDLLFWKCIFLKWLP